MNRLLLFLLPLFFISSLYSQNNPIDVYNSTPFYDENGVQLNDGDIIQMIYAGADQMINPPVTNSSSGNNGQPTGDDVVLSLHYIGENVPPNTGTFYFTATAYPNHTYGYPAAGDYIYVRVFNAQNLPSATHYGDGQLHLVTNLLGDSYDVQIPGGQTGNPLPVEHDRKTGDIPSGYKLWQNYPNPFNPSTTINYQLVQPGSVEIAIYNVLGEKIQTLVNEEQQSGAHAVVWDGEDREGRAVASGLYLYRLTAGEFVASRKRVLRK